MAKRTIVEINGRQYDANTGRIITETPTASRVIDGFQAPIDQPSTNNDVQPARRSVNTSNSVHQAPQQTKKLHPAVLRQPQTPKKVMAKSTTVAKTVTVPKAEAVRLGSSVSRAERAQAHNRSEHVTKFNKQQVEQPPAQVPTEDVVETLPAAPVTQPMPRPAVERPQVNPQPEPETQVEAEQKNGFFRRLGQKRPKLLPVAMTTAVVLLLGGYVAYQNIPNMALRVAAQRAGFNATLPGYSPSGFEFSGPVAYADGIVELEYHSNSDARSYSLVQRESSWDSQSLLDNFVVNASDDYLTFQERGVTVYVYDASNATWVDGGIWYTIEGNSLLNSEQLLKIAGSL